MKNKKTEIDLVELKRVVDAIFGHLLNDVGITKISLSEDDDFYWEVPDDRLHAVQKDQPRLDIGRLTDDWEFLSAILKDRKQAVGIMFMHVAPLLRYISAKAGR